MTTRPIPALIIGGFLGAGKTTLVRHLLAQSQEEGVRLAIISNEFGDTGIDKALLEAGSESLVELDGGCVCCRLSDALGETLEMLLTQVKPDRLVIETSGVALPGELLIQFWRPPIDELVDEEVVVVVVDGEFYLRGRPDDETFLAQVQAADLVILNKCDLLEDASIKGAEHLLAQLTDGQPILRSVRSEVDPDLLFPPDPEGARRARRSADARPRPHSHEEFTTIAIEVPDGLSEAEVRKEVYDQHALRAKGFVRTPQGVCLVQGVGPRIEVEPAPIEPPEELIGKVVLIRRVRSGDDAGG